MDDAKKKGITL